jgi:hypothetical protein
MAIAADSTKYAFFTVCSLVGVRRYEPYSIMAHLSGVPGRRAKSPPRIRKTPLPKDAALCAVREGGIAARLFVRHFAGLPDYWYSPPLAISLSGRPQLSGPLFPDPASKSLLRNTASAARIIAAEHTKSTGILFISYSRADAYRVDYVPIYHACQVVLMDVKTAQQK